MNLNQQIADFNGMIAALFDRFPELADDEVLRADTFSGETNIEELLTQVVSMANDAAAMATAIKGRISDLVDRKTRFESREEAMRDLAQQIMERADLKKVTLPEATLSLSYRAPSPVITDEAQLPDTACKFKRSPDMSRIKALLAEGHTLAGVAMGNGKTVLTIRTK